MDYYFDVCDIFIKPKSKYKHFKSTSHKKFDICKHVFFSVEDIDIKNVNEPFFYTLSITIKNSIIIL